MQLVNLSLVSIMLVGFPCSLEVLGNESITQGYMQGIANRICEGTCRVRSSYRCGF